MSHRMAQLSSVIKEELSNLLLTHVDRNAFQLITITKVIVTKDLSLAKAYISSPKGNINDFLKWVKPKMYDIQGDLNRKLFIRKIPRIVFEKDETSEYVTHIDTLLYQIKQKDKALKKSVKKEKENESTVKKPKTSTKK